MMRDERLGYEVNHEAGWVWFNFDWPENEEEDGTLEFALTPDEALAWAADIMQQANEARQGDADPAYTDVDPAYSNEDDGDDW